MNNGFLFHISSFAIFAERESMSPPTTARQLETEAVSPIIIALTGDIVPPIPILRIQDFCKRMNHIRKTSPKGIA